jgi:hypothetical protein
LANAKRKISPNRITGLPGHSPPDDVVGLFIACEKTLQERARSRWSSTMTLAT